MTSNALGLIETKGLIGAIAAADVAAKAAAVSIATAELTDAAFMTIKIIGELGAVQAAVEAGASEAERIGELVSAHVIARPDEELVVMLPNRRYISKYHSDDTRPGFGTTPSRSTTPTPAPRTLRAPTGGAPKADATVRVEKPKPDAPKKSEPKVQPPQPKPQITKPKPAPQSEPPLIKPAPPKPETPKSEPPETASVTMADLEKMPVVKLRKFARTIKGLPIQGRQISMANKTVLLEAIENFLDLK